MIKAKSNWQGLACLATTLYNLKKKKKKIWTFTLGVSFLFFELTQIAFVCLSQEARAVTKAWCLT